MSTDGVIRRYDTPRRRKALSPPYAIMGCALIAAVLLLAGFQGAGWAEMVPDILLSMNVAGSGTPVHAIVVEKRSQTLSVYRYDGALRKVAGYPCSTGKIHGDKWVSGDLKTPEGVYFFTDHHEDGDLSAVYGTRAYPLNYPNVVDRGQGKDGFAIWLHGTDRPLAPRDSNGCIAMNNDDIDRLAPLIELERTPIVIVETLREVPSGDMAAPRARISEFIDAWLRQMTIGAHHQYLALYAPDYLPPIDWWRPWQDFRRSAVAADGRFEIGLDDLSLYRHQDLVLAFFRQTLRVGPHRIAAGRRTLFIRDVDGELHIVGDDYHRIGGDPDGADGAPPLIEAVRQVQQAGGGQDRVAAFLERWLDAWSAQDIDAYGACYADSFTAKGMTKSQWLAYKRSLNDTYSRIQVSASDITYRLSGETPVVAFTQHYTSNRFHSEGRKTLHLRRENDQWKITRERYSGK